MQAFQPHQIPNALLTARPKRKQQANLLNHIIFGIVYLLVLFFLSCGLIYSIRSWKISRLNFEETRQQEVIDGQSEIIRFKSREIFNAFDQEEDASLEKILNDQTFPPECLQKALYDYTYPARPHLAEKCITRGRLAPLATLFKSGLKVNINELNLFNLAIRNLSKHPDQVNFLNLITKMGADFNAIDPELSLPPLFIAISYKNLVALEFILSRGITPNQIHPRLGSPLHFTVKTFSRLHRINFIEIIKILLKYGANPFIFLPNSGLNPLHYAIEKHSNCLDLIESFFNAPIPNCDHNKYRLKLINHRTGTDNHLAGYTPSHLAVEKGSITLILKLIELGADLSLKNSDGLTPQELATRLKSRKLMAIFNNLNKSKN